MNAHLKKLIKLALGEDFGKYGDVTSQAIFRSQRSRALLLCKGTGILAGSDIFSAVFQLVDPSLSIDFLFTDGAPLDPGTVVATVSGRTGTILTGERTALNFISFFSGIATKTRAFVEEARLWGDTKILDTRKTLPGLRAFSKAAVLAGGGHNHRAGLYDMVLIKDNHIDAAGSITTAVGLVRRRWGGRFQIEVECRTLTEVKEAVQSGVDRIMLDNMDAAGLTESLKLIAGRTETEISGGVKLEDLKTYVGLGATYISVGALTHSVTALDFSLDMTKGQTE